MSVRVIDATGEKEIQQSYQLRFDTMCRDLGWLSSGDYAVPEEKDEYDEGQSIPFLALDITGTVIGTSRILLPGAIPLPVEQYFELHPREDIEKKHGKLSYAVEISRFIVSPAAASRHHEITLVLCMTMLGRLLRMGASHAYVSADHRFFRLLSILGISFDHIGEPKFYMGSKTIPGITNLAVLASTLKKERPKLYQMASRETAE
jgi:N-acyl-L-homoserine lactone synthetase